MKTKASAKIFILLTAAVFGLTSIRAVLADPPPPPISILCEDGVCTASDASPQIDNTVDPVKSLIKIQNATDLRDVSISSETGKAPRSVQVLLSNGGKATTAVTIDLSSKKEGSVAGNVVFLGDTVGALTIDLSGKNGALGKDASQLCADAIISGSLGTTAKTDFLNRRQPGSAPAPSDRCDSVDLASVATPPDLCSGGTTVNTGLDPANPSLPVTRYRSRAKCGANFWNESCRRDWSTVSCAANTVTLPWIHQNIHGIEIYEWDKSFWDPARSPARWQTDKVPTETVPFSGDINAEDWWTPVPGSYGNYGSGSIFQLYSNFAEWIGSGSISDRSTHPAYTADPMSPKPAAAFCSNSIYSGAAHITAEEATPIRYGTTQSRFCKGNPYTGKVWCANEEYQSVPYSYSYVSDARNGGSVSVSTRNITNGPKTVPLRNDMCTQIMDMSGQPTYCLGGDTWGLLLNQSPIVNDGVLSNGEPYCTTGDCDLSARVMAPLGSASLVAKIYPSLGQWLFLNSAGNDLYVASAQWAQSQCTYRSQTVGGITTCTSDPFQPTDTSDPFYSSPLEYVVTYYTIADGAYRAYWNTSNASLGNIIDGVKRGGAYGLNTQPMVTHATESHQSTDTQLSLPFESCTDPSFGSRFGQYWHTDGARHYSNLISSSTIPDEQSCAHVPKSAFDPDGDVPYQFLGMWRDPNSSFPNETVNCTKDSCDGNNFTYTESSAQLTTLSPTAGFNGTANGDAIIFAYDIASITQRAAYGAAGSPGRADMNTIDRPQMCSLVKDSTTLRSDGVTTFGDAAEIVVQKINFAPFRIGSVPPEPQNPAPTANQVRIYKKIDSSVRYMIERARFPR